MPGLSDVVHILFPEYISLGTFIRLRRTNRSLYMYLETDPSAWIYFFRSVKMKWSASLMQRFRTHVQSFGQIHANITSRQSIVHFFLNHFFSKANRCRECGRRGGLATLSFYLCSSCSCESGNYSHLVSSSEVKKIVQDAGNGWRRKLPSNFTSYSPPLPVIRRTNPFKKRLYWAKDAYSLKKKYEDRKKCKPTYT